MKTSLIFLAVLLIATPFAAAGDAIFSDDYAATTLEKRQLLRGDWKVSNGVAKVAQDDELYKKYKNHGPIVFYDVPLGDAVVSFDVKLEDAKRFVFTLNAEKGHLFRFLQQGDAGWIRVWEQTGEHKAVALAEDTPAIVNDQWVAVKVEVSGDHAIVRIGDGYVKKLSHPAIASAKRQVGISFHFGAMSLRNFRIEKPHTATD